MNLLTGAVQPHSGKDHYWRNHKIWLLHSRSGIAIKEGQKVIDVIREFGEFIPLKEGPTDLCATAAGTLSF